jgi:hypothetical protein
VTKANIVLDGVGGATIARDDPGSRLASMAVAEGARAEAFMVLAGQNHDQQRYNENWHSTCLENTM